MSVYIDIIPEVRNDMFFARVIMSDYNLDIPLSITIESRRADGEYMTKTIVYPDLNNDYQGNIIIPFFGMYKAAVAQIINVRVNGEYIYTEYKKIGDSDIHVRYNDSLIRISDFVDKSDIRIYFQVEDTHNPKTLRVVDESVWGILSGRVAVIEIFVPGREKPSVHYLGKNQANIFNSMSLGINCDGDKVEMLDLPDGIYTITVKGSPSSYNLTRKFLKTDSARLRMDRKWVKASFLCDDRDDDIISMLREAEFCLSSAEANIRLDNTCEANELMSRLDEILDDLEGCTNC